MVWVYCKSPFYPFTECRRHLDPEHVAGDTNTIIFHIISATHYCHWHVATPQRSSLWTFPVLFRPWSSCMYEVAMFHEIMFDPIERATDWLSTMWERCRIHAYSSPSIPVRSLVHVMYIRILTVSILSLNWLHIATTLSSPPRLKSLHRITSEYNWHGSFRTSAHVTVVYYSW